VSLSGGFQSASFGEDRAKGGYGRGEAWLKGAQSFGGDSMRVLSVRAFIGGATSETPLQRRVFVSARDPYQTLFNHFIRPSGGILTRDIVPTVALGGAGLRGYDPALAVGSHVFALNVEESSRLVSLTSGPRPLAIWTGLFADAARTEGRTLTDAGVGAMLRGWVFDRDVRIRIDLPLYLSDPLLEGGRYSVYGRRWTPERAGDRIRFDRVQLTLGSFW
jgi:hypothetical protein